MTEHVDPSAAKIETTRVRLAAMECEAQEIARFMCEGYGADDRRAIRAGEMLASIQRLRWELDPDLRRERHAVAT